MLQYMANFTPSFLLALLLWPFAALALTIPILIIQYRRFNKLNWRRAIAVYLFIFYLLGLVCFTLYPFPENTLAFCRENNLLPQLRPLQFISDTRTDGLSAVLQVVMNFVFFLPMGVFMRLLFRTKLRTAFLVSLGGSILIETAQLAGVFGLYPCSYRLFDVDDLMLNTLGGVSGYLVAKLVPQHELETAEHGDYVRQAGLIRHTIALLIDTAASTILSMLILTALYLTVGTDSTMAIRDGVPFVSVTLVFGVLPLLMKGWSLGGVLVRLNHDDQQRRALRRIVYYTVRTLIAFLIITPLPGWQWLRWLIVLAILIVWRKQHKLPHQFI